jgi:hypothetical protein
MLNKMNILNRWKYNNDIMQMLSLITEMASSVSQGVATSVGAKVHRKSTAGLSAGKYCMITNYSAQPFYSLVIT